MCMEIPDALREVLVRVLRLLNFLTGYQIVEGGLTTPREALRHSLSPKVVSLALM